MATRKMLEILENRTLLSTALPTSPVGNSGSAAIVDRILVIQGSEIADEIHVSAYFKTATVIFINADVDESATFDRSEYDQIQVAAGGGDDTVDVGASLPAGVTVHGDAGNDKLNVGNGLVYSISAPPTTDWANTVYPDVVYGDAGDDTLAGGDSDMYGGRGYDTVVYSSRATYPAIYSVNRWIFDYSHPMYAVASIDDVANDGIYGHNNVHSDVEVVLGYQGAVIASVTPLPTTATDTHTGSASIVDGTLVIQGSNDDDTISVSTQDGSTTVKLANATVNEVATFDNADFTQIQITGGTGNDRITLDTSVTVKATLDGGDGDDTLTGGGGNDLLLGGDGNDTADYSMETADLDSDGFLDLIATDRGHDFIRVETLLSGSGNDHLVFHPNQTGEDVIKFIDAGAGDDVVSISSFAPTVHGGDGNDSLFIASGTTGTYFGDDGDDMFPIQRYGFTTIRDFHGGAGIDTVDYSNGYPTVPIKVTIDDLPNDGPIGDQYHAKLGDNVHADVEVVRGSYANDTIIGSVNDETLVGGHGNDCLVGNGGNDSLDGGDGNNTILDFLPPPPPPPPPVVAPAGSPTLSDHILHVDGTTGSDRITLRHKPGDASILQVVLKGVVSDFTFSDVNKIEVLGGNGNDLIDLRDIEIGSTILGGNGNDSIYGSQAADSIDGGSGDDLLAGMAGNDSITGGIGADVIRGGEGIDRLFARVGVDDIAKNKGDQLINDVLT